MMYLSSIEFGYNGHFFIGNSEDRKDLYMHDHYGFFVVLRMTEFYKFYQKLTDGLTAEGKLNVPAGVAYRAFMKDMKHFYCCLN